MLINFRDGPGYYSDDDKERVKRIKALGDKNSIFSEDPWNAICVLGLRVYSLNADAKISVVKGDDSL